MKVTLDLDQLLRDGQITPEEHARLGRLGARDTGALGVNILIGFGVVSVAGGTVALLPDPLTGIVLGLALLVAGVLVVARLPRWLVLGNVLLLVAALLFGGGLIALRGATPGNLLVMAAVAAAAAVAAQSALMTALAVLSLDAILGSGTGYRHAEYEVAINQPTLTVVLFAALGWVAYLASRRLPPQWERLALVSARTSVFLVNMGFWIGSLWGDEFGRLDEAGTAAARIPAGAFAIIWAVALLAVGAWAVAANRRWPLNLVAVFAGIHFYTQWFERLGATPGSVLGAGMLVLVFAIALWRWNERTARRLLDAATT